MSKCRTRINPFAFSYRTSAIATSISRANIILVKEVAKEDLEQKQFIIRNKQVLFSISDHITSILLGNFGETGNVIGLDEFHRLDPFMM